MKPAHTRALRCLWAAAVWVAMGAAAAPAPAKEHTSWLRPAECTLRGLVSRGRGVELAPVFSQKGSEALCLRAADGTASTPVVPLADPEARGGACLHVPDNTGQNGVGAVSFQVSLAAGGRYTLWAHTYWLGPGANSLFEAADSSPEEVLGNTEAPGELLRWHWVRGQTYDLAAGLHALRIRWREDGTRLDALILAPEGQVPADPAEAVRPVMAAEGTVETPDFQPQRVSRWLGVAVDAQPLSRPEGQVSTDGGRSWLPLARLAGLPAGGKGADRVRVRLWVAAPASGDGPTIRRVGVRYAGESGIVALENRHVRLELDGPRGSLASLVNRDLGVPYCEGPAGGPVFALRALDPDTRKMQDVPLPPSTERRYERRARGDAQEAILRFRMPGPSGGCVDVTCSALLAGDSREVAWQIAVKNDAPRLEIVDVVYPILGGLCIGDRPEANALTWPAWGAGHLIPEACRQATRSGAYLGGSATMQWMDLFRGHGMKAAAGEAPPCGLYFASHDPSLLMTGLACQASADGQSVTLSMSKHARVAPGERWESAPFATALHAGDWHAGADRYRAWFSGWCPPTKPPTWLKECDGWLGGGFGAKSTFREMIASQFSRAQALGLNYVEFWGQMIPGPASPKSGCNRLPLPDPANGTEQELAEAVAAVRRAGGHIGFYTNGQAWDPRWPEPPPGYAGRIPPGTSVPEWEKGFRANALQLPDGSLYTQYPKPEGDRSPYPCMCYLMCPGSAGWPEHLRRWIVGKYAREYGVDAHYVDQVGADVAKVCFNPEHRHRHPGEWSQAHLASFRRMQEEARAIRPGFVLATEGHGDAYSPYVDIFLASPASTGAWPTSFPELVRYTFPTHILFDGFANGLAGATRTRAGVMNEVFLLGSRFDYFPGSPADDHYAALVFDLRRRIKHVLYPGRFLDDLGVTLSDPRVRAKRTLLVEAGHWATVLTFYNPQHVAGATITVELGEMGPVRRAAVMRLAGGVEPTRPVVAGGAATFTVPAETLSAALLVSQGDDLIERATSARQLAQPTEADRKAALGR